MSESLGLNGPASKGRRDILFWRAQPDAPNSSGDEPWSAANEFE
jgi:hypothetical protein